MTRDGRGSGSRRWAGSSDGEWVQSVYTIGDQSGERVAYCDGSNDGRVGAICACRRSKGVQSQVQRARLPEVSRNLQRSRSPATRIRRWTRGGGVSLSDRPLAGALCRTTEGRVAAERWQQNEQQRIWRCLRAAIKSRRCKHFVIRLSTQRNTKRFARRGAAAGPWSSSEGAFPLSPESSMVAAEPSLLTQPPPHISTFTLRNHGR